MKLHIRTTIPSVAVEPAPTTKLPWIASDYTAYRQTAPFSESEEIALPQQSVLSKTAKVFMQGVIPIDVLVILDVCHLFHVPTNSKVAANSTKLRSPTISPVTF
jgi:hypothetical protein